MTIKEYLLAALSEGKTTHLDPFWHDLEAERKHWLHECMNIQQDVIVGLIFKGEAKVKSWLEETSPTAASMEL